MSQPSRFASRSARWIAGRDSGAEGQESTRACKSSPKNLDRNLAELTQRERAPDEGRHHSNRAAARGRDSLVDLVRENFSRAVVKILGVRAAADQRRESRCFTVPDALPPLHSVGISPNLLIHRVAEPKSLVAQLVDIFRFFGVDLGRINAANGFQ